MPATPAWLAAVEGWLNRGIDTSYAATALARRLEATVVRVDVTGMLSVHAAVRGGRLSLAAAPRVSAGSELVSATITASPLALLGAAQAGGTARPGARSQLQIRGDAEIANSYRQLLIAARPDAEEELSRLVGDGPARGLSQFALGMLEWGRRARRTVGENLAEYLQEESRDLVGKLEVDEFSSGVDIARDTAARIDDRLSRLEQRLQGRD